MDVRRETCIVIRKNGEYLVGTIVFSTQLRWSNNLYDAWRTRDREKAEKMARMTGGIMVLFNPVTHETKVLGA